MFTSCGSTLRCDRVLFVERSGELPVLARLRAVSYTHLDVYKRQELEELRTTCDRIAIVSGGKIAGILPATESSEEFGMLMVSQVK